MSSFLARTTMQNLMYYSPHTSVSGETWQYIKAGVTTSNGAANGTTIIDTGGDSGGARTYSGRYWVECTSGANTGDWKRVVADDGAGTLTLENNGFDGQVVSGVSYRIWLSPEPVCTVTGTTSTTIFAAGSRIGEGDDFWNGYELMVIYASDNGGTSPLRGETQTILDFTSATGTFEVDTAFSNQPRVGDVLLIGKFIEFGSPSPGYTNEYIPRLGNRVNFSMGDGVVGPRGGTYAFNTQIRPSGTLAGDTSVANKSEISGLFQAVGLVENQDTSAAVVNDVSSTTVIEVAAGTEEGFTIGNMVIVNGVAAFITAKGDGTGTAAADQITVTPALPVAPTNTAGDVVYATCGYHKSTDADVYGVCLTVELDGVRHTMTGCKGSVQLVDGAAPELTWNFNVDHWTREIEAAPYANVSNTLYSTAQCVQSKDRLAYLSTTRTNIGSFTATPGTTTAAKPMQGSIGVNGRSGYQLTNFAARATWNELLNASNATITQESRYQARTSRDVIVVLGTNASTFGCRLPVARMVEAPHPTDLEGMQGVPIVWEAQDAGQYSNTDITTQKVPDFSFHLT